MKSKLLSIVICLFFLTGCWDQRLLKNSKVVYSVAFDSDKDNEILVTGVIKTNSQASKGTEQPASTNVIESAKGHTLSETRMKMFRKVSGDFATNKTRLLILGNEIAKKDIYPLFDIVYRDPRSSLGAKVLVSKRRGDEILKLNVVGETLVGEEILNLITTAENQTLVPIENVQEICSLLFDPGQDLILPLIDVNDEKVINVLGAALFNGKQYTGYDLINDDATLFLLLHDKKEKMANFSIDVNPKEKVTAERYVSILVNHSKSKLKIKTSKKDKITVEINLKMKVAVTEYAKDNLADPKEIDKLNKKISKILTVKAENIIKTLQAANCDGFGIGRDLISFNPRVWEKLNKKDYFQNITIIPKVKVEILDTGIIK